MNDRNMARTRGPIEAATRILGTVRDVVRGVEVGYVGPWIELHADVPGDDGN